MKQKTYTAPATTIHKTLGQPFMSNSQPPSLTVSDDGRPLVDTSGTPEEADAADACSRASNIWDD